MAITLKNLKWKNGINVEVRGNIGMSESDVPLVGLGSKKIALQDSWVIENSPKLPFAHYEYRRDNSPDNPDGTFTEWTKISHLGGDIEVVLE